MSASPPPTDRDRLDGSDATKARPVRVFKNSRIVDLPLASMEVDR
jgi:hypothetical protein